MQTTTYRNKAGQTRHRPILTEAELRQDNTTGFCLACGSDQLGVEPDARRYTCEGCGQPKVYGLEELVLMGIAIITGDDYKVEHR
jgi:hypothetical protein